MQCHGNLHMPDRTPASPSRHITSPQTCCHTIPQTPDSVILHESLRSSWPEPMLYVLHRQYHYVCRYVSMLKISKPKAGYPIFFVDFVDGSMYRDRVHTANDVSPFNMPEQVPNTHSPRYYSSSPSPHYPTPSSELSRTPQPHI